MIVFQVVTEHTVDDDLEIIKTVQYVTSKGDRLKDVVDYFTIHCEQYEMELKSVSEVLTVVQQLEKL